MKESLLKISNRDAVLRDGSQLAIKLISLIGLIR